MSSNAIHVLSTRGAVFTDVPSPWERSTAARHWNAIREFLEYGDDRALRSLEVELLQSPSGVMVGDVELGFDLDLIEAEAFRGEVRFESIYES